MEEADPGLVQYLEQRKKHAEKLGRFHFEQEFKGKTLLLDDAYFMSCKIHNCQLQYSGGVPPIIRGCEFAYCDFVFLEHAENTLLWLHTFLSASFSSRDQAVAELVKAVEAVGGKPFGPQS